MARRLWRRLATALLAMLVVPAVASAAPTVAIFYYPWYGNPSSDGGYEMWAQNGHAPPGDIYSAFFPMRGVYSNTSPRLLDRQMAEIAAAGVDEVVTSWWGWGSPTDRRLPAVLEAARRHGLTVAVHIEPFDERDAEAVVRDVGHLYELGITDMYVYNAERITAADWAAVRPRIPLPVRMFAQTGRVGFAAAAGFDGVYTYDIVTYPGSKFGRLCAQARKANLLCAPSIGPGYDAIRASGDLQHKPRRAGKTYDAMWQAALRASADLVTITSYNEWGEGTQIEPARILPGYQSYDGAWGLHGAAAARAYLDRTARWAARFRSAS